MDAANLTAENPYLKDSPRSRSLRGALEASFPREAQELQIAAEVPLSLAAQAWEQGLTEMDKDIRQELASKRPEILQVIEAEAKEKYAADFYARMDKESEIREQRKEEQKREMADLAVESIQVARESLRY